MRAEPDAGGEQPTPTPLPTFSDSLLARTADVLEARADAITERWLEGADGAAPVRAGLEETPAGAGVSRPLPLVAVIGRLRDRDGADRQRLVALLQRRWQDAGLVGDEVDPYFGWLRQAVFAVVPGAVDPVDDAKLVLDCFTHELDEVRHELSALESERLYAERDELRNQLDAVFMHVSDPVVIVETARGRIRTANAAAVELTGYPLPRLRMMSLGDLCPALRGPALRAFLSELLDRGSASCGHSLLTRRDHSAVGFRLEAHLVQLGGGPVAFSFLHPTPAPAASNGPPPAAGGEFGPEVANQVGEVERLKTFMENVISALPMRLLVLDADLRILHANPAYYIQRGLTRDRVVGRAIDEVFSAELLEAAGLRAALLSVIETGERVRWSGYREATPQHTERVVNFRLDPCEGPDGSRTVLLTMEDITERHTQLYERTILQQISHALLGELDLPKLLHAILTGMTAGGAVGLGFNRAILMLVDEEAGVLRAEMAVGPENLEHAIAIWQEVSQDHRTLQDFLADYDHLPPMDRRPLHDLVSELVVPLDRTDTLPMAAVVAHQTVHVVDAELDRRVTPELARLLESNEFVVAPLVARDKIIGAAIADNRFSQQPINQGAVQLLTTLADQAALAIDTARTFRRAKEDAEHLDAALRALQAAQEENLRTAKLAAVGEVTAIVAHEIRSPLSAIGGFARSIEREPELVERSARNARIIVEEVVRLEGILGELLDFSKPAEPRLALADLAPLIHSMAEHARQADEEGRVTVRVAVEPNVPMLMVDEKQVRQIVQNLVMNALQAMPHGGTLTLGLRTRAGQVQVLVQDTGEGIPRERLALIFDAFFTSKPTGTGLGLALCKKLATQLGADMSVESEVGRGTTFIVSFPLATVGPGPERAPAGAPPKGV